MSGANAPADVSSQRRRAVVASTIGTTIEWYDFFLLTPRPRSSSARCSSVRRRSAGCCWRSAPSSSVSPRDRWGGHLRARRRPDRSQAITRGDTAGHGYMHGAHRPVADLRDDRCRRTDPADRAPDRAGNRCRRRVRAPALSRVCPICDGLTVSDSECGEGVVVVVQVAAGVGDVGASGQAQGADRQVAEGRECSGCGAGAQLGCVLTEGDVADLLRGWASVAVAHSSRLRSSEADEVMLGSATRVVQAGSRRFTWWGGER